MGTQQLVFIFSTQRMQLSHSRTNKKRNRFFSSFLQEIRAEKKKTQREKNKQLYQILVSFSWWWSPLTTMQSQNQDIQWKKEIISLSIRLLILFKILRAV